eukprot:sb/3470583/
MNPGMLEHAQTQVDDPLTVLTEQMNDHYKYLGTRDTKHYPAIGEIVAAPDSNTGSYRRSRVVETDEAGEKSVRVFHLDFGTFDTIKENRLRLMHEKFLEDMPFLAQEMFLADVQPLQVEGGKEYFMETITDRWLVAKVVDRSRDGSMRVHLWNCESEVPTSINRGLVENNYATQIHELPGELTTDCSVYPSSTNYSRSATSL